MSLEKGEVCDLSDVVLNENINTDEHDKKSLKQPVRVLHFSDGDLEYSEDEVDTTEVNKVEHIDPKTLTWLPWTWYQTTWVGNKILNGCDYVGEWLADFFGITSPKYEFEINEFYRLQALENEKKHKQDLEMGGWNPQNQNNLINSNNI
ncbi:protein FAM177A1 [Megachile rotundata]|uniref:protein FAM177A1 n=1 Tax=Megachile rotundata TaxID=143995 RepID=UPI000258D5B2|nr:PREDICTED: protein FAM177A1-like [Megachile rotundata]